MTIGTRILLVTVVSLLVAVIVTTAVAVTAIRRQSEADMTRYRAEELSKTRAKLKNLVDVAYAAIEGNDKEAQDRAFVEKIHGRRLKDVIGIAEPILKEIVIGKLLVKEVFQVSKVGTVAGCLVDSGKISRKASVRLRRGEEIVFNGRVSSLKRFKDDVKEVQEGTECGVGLEGFSDILKGDVIEAYHTEKIERKLE